MADTRHKDSNWNADGCLSSGKANVALLMDLRDELKQLNRVFACQNFQAMPNEIRKLRLAAERLDRRFAKGRKLR